MKVAANHQSHANWHDLWIHKHNIAQCLLSAWNSCQKQSSRWIRFLHFGDIYVRNDDSKSIFFNNQTENLRIRACRTRKCGKASYNGTINLTEKVQSSWRLEPRSCWFSRQIAHKKSSLQIGKIRLVLM